MDQVQEKRKPDGGQSVVVYTEIEEKDLTERKTCCSKVYPTGFWFEFKGTMRLAWALVLVQASQFAFNTVATMFGGHLGKLELDAIALANTIINSFGNAIVVGFSSCLDTVLSQSYGMGNYRMFGIYMQRGIILHILALLPCLALHLNIKPILLVLGQQPDVVELTAQYLLYFLPGLFFLFMWTALRKFTQCQNLVIPHIVIILAGHAIHALLQYLFLYELHLGIIGSAIAQALTYFVMFVATLIYSRCSEGYKLCWYGWDKQCLMDWGPLAALAVFGMLMVCMEWWVFEASVLMAGVLGDTELAAQSITFNLDGISFGVPSGIALATSIRVGQFLGAGRKLGAINAARIGMTIAAINAALWAILFISLRNELPKLFTEDPDVINLASQLIPLVALYTTGDGISVVGRGVLRGTGQQKWATVIIIVAYYVVALPIAIPVTFLTPLGIKGIWIGLPLALCLTGLIYVVATNFCFNWEKLKDEALQRASGKGNSSTDKDETTALLSNGSHGTQGLIPKDFTIPTSVYLKRAVIVTFFVGILVAGIIARVTTQSSSDTTSVLPPLDPTQRTSNGTLTTMTFESFE